MGLSKRLRFEILRRDKFTCWYCGRRPPEVVLTVDHVTPEVVLTVDHVTPVALGGKDEPANLVAACQECNAGHSSVAPDAPVVGQISRDADRWARAITLAAEVRSVERGLINRFVQTVDEAWSQWTIGNTTDPCPRDVSWPDTVERFFKIGLDLDTMTHLVGVAMRNQRVHCDEKWNYFCGCCWRAVDELQVQARDFINEGEA